MQHRLPRLSPETAETLFHSYVMARRTAWSVLKASGEGLRDYLQGQLTQDIRRLTQDRGIHACLLTPQGRPEAELYLLEGVNDELILLTPSEYAEATVARLRRFALGYQLRIGIVASMGVCTIQGANAVEGLNRFGLSEPGAGWLATSHRDDRHALCISEDPRGFWVMAADEAIDRCLADSEHAVAEDQIEAMRIIQGLPRFGCEWDASVYPLNANLIEFQGVSFDKGCYVGQEVTSRMHWRGGIRKRLYRCRLGKAPETDLPCPVRLNSGSAIGELKSAALDHEGVAHGIVWLPIEVAESASSGLTLEDGTGIELGEACHAG